MTQLPARASWYQILFLPVSSVSHTLDFFVLSSMQGMDRELQGVGQGTLRGSSVPWLEVSLRICHLFEPYHSKTDALHPLERDVATYTDPRTYVSPTEFRVIWIQPLSNSTKFNLVPSRCWPWRWHWSIKMSWAAFALEELAVWWVRHTQANDDTPWQGLQNRQTENAVRKQLGQNNAVWACVLHSGVFE